MVGGLAGYAALEPVPVPLFGLRRDLALGMEPQGDFLDPPRSSQQPRRLPPRIRKPFPPWKRRGPPCKCLRDGHGYFASTTKTQRHEGHNEDNFCVSRESES
jgi:hypothetical protein